MKLFPAKEHRFLSYIIAVFILLSGVLIIGGYFYYVNFRHEYLHQAEHTLTAISKLQVKEIVQWRKERVGDGVTHFRNDVFYDLFKKYCQHPSDKPIKKSLSDWVGNLIRYYDYNRITLFDRDGKEVAAVPNSAEPPDTNVIHCVHTVVSSGKDSIVDLYRHGIDQKVYMTILVPIRRSGIQQSIGVAALRIDPNVNLFPIIEEFPTVRKTGESLLFRREGDEIVFLNNMKFISKPALTFRVSITRTELPAVKEAIGQKGFVAGVDYRGIPVYASTSNIPNSPWYLVVKINKDEVEQPITERLWQLQALILAIILGTGGVVGYVVRTQRYNMLKERMDAVKQQQFLQGIIKNSLNEIYIFDADTLRFTFVNDASCRNLQYTQEEMLTLTPIDIKPMFTSEKYRDVLTPLLDRQKMGITFETIHRRKDGSMYPVEVHLQMMELTEGNIIVTFVNDISARKKNEEKMNRTLRELERSNKELEQFAYVASHDLQEPLRMVSSYTQLLSRRYKDKLDDDANDFINFAVDGSKRMQRLIDDLLDYSRITTRGKDFVTIDCNAVLGETIVILQNKIRDTNAVITNSELPSITGDTAQITRLFQNLIDNAIKYRKKDQLPIIHISSIDHNDEVEFIVQDNGIGIDHAYQDRIFIIFQRLHSKEEYLGSGIGLSICKRIVERHHGRIWFESVLGSGTAFHFMLKKHLPNEPE